MMHEKSRRTFLMVVSLLFLHTHASNVECPPAGATALTIAGGLPVQRLVQGWADAYLDYCPSTTPWLNIQGGGSSTGAARVCGTRTPAVDIGGMTRPVNRQEATSDNGWEYDCARSTRSTVQIEVAIEGTAASFWTAPLDVTSGNPSTPQYGAAHDCIVNHLHHGLTIDQLRWIFTNFEDESDLAKDGSWSAANAIPNSDGNSSTRLWSELHPSCANQEIVFASPPRDSFEYDLIKALILTGLDEDLHPTRGTLLPDGTPQEEFVSQLTSWMQENPNGISYLGIVQVLTQLDSSKVGLVFYRESLLEESAVQPTGVTFQDGEFPLARRLYLNVAQDQLEKVAPFLEFALLGPGRDLINSIGFWELDEWELLVMATRIQSKSGIPFTDIQSFCQDIDENHDYGILQIAGSSTVFPVARIWQRIYELGCPQVKITVEGGGSSSGAGRVCANPDRGTPVQIGDMSRQWKSSEASVAEAGQEGAGFLYNCRIGDMERSAIQLDVAIDGLTVAVQVGGIAQDCINKIGGLSIDQLRWIYSSYTDQQLLATGWDPSSLPNSDGNPGTHLWSELDSRCAPVEIRVAGADDESGTYEYFLESVLSDFDNGETFATEAEAPHRPIHYFDSEDDVVLVDYLEQYAEAVSYFGYSYYYANQNLLSAVPIGNEQGKFVLPQESTIADGSYSPLARRIYMNALNDKNALKLIRGFIKFGFSQESLVAATGYVVIPNVEEMLQRLEDAPYNDGGSSTNVGAIVGGVLGGLAGVCIMAFAYTYWCRNQKEKDVMNTNLDVRQSTQAAGAPTAEEAAPSISRTSSRTGNLRPASIT